MPNNRNDDHGVALVLAIAWIVFVVAYPRSWHASPLVLEPLAPGERACVLKLPAEGPLRVMIEPTSALTLMFQTPAPCASPCSTAPPFEAAGPTVPLPTPHETRSAVRVLGTTCLSADRQSDCYAVLALKEPDASTVMATGRVWVSIEHQ